MTFNHFPIFFFSILLFAIGVSSSQAQSIGKRLFQQSYIQLSGIPHYLGLFPDINGYHVQLAIGTRLKNSWGVGLGAGSWKIRDAGDRSTRYTVLGPHIRYINDRWIAHLETGAMIGYRFLSDGLNLIEDISLAQPFRSPFIRAQYGIRFLNRWIVGLSGSFLPAIKTEGIRQALISGEVDETSYVSQTITKWGGQVFVGILLERRRAKKN